MRPLAAAGALAASAFVVAAAVAIPPPGAPGPKPAPARVGGAVKESECVPKTDSDPLKVYLPFTGNLTDASGHCHDGFRTDAVLAADRNGVASHAYQFDGINDVIQVQQGQHVDLSKFTIALWVNATAFPKQSQGSSNPSQNCGSYALINKGRAVSPDYYGNFDLSIRHCGGASYFNVDYSHGTPPPAGSAQTQATGAIDWNTYVDKGKWNHLAVTYEGGTLKIYVNGNATVTKAGIAAPAQNSEPIRVGLKATGSSDTAFQGMIDEVRVYDRALTAAEIGAVLRAP
jgi:hypothetical protein